MKESSIAEKNAARRIANGMITSGFMTQSYTFFRCLSRIHAMTKATADITRKSQALLKPFVVISLMAMPRQKRPRRIQIISIARIPFLFIINVYGAGDVFYSSICKAGIRFKACTHYDFIFKGKSDEPVRPDTIPGFTPVE